MTSDIRLRDDGNIEIISDELVLLKKSEDVPDDEAEGSYAPGAANLALGGHGQDGDVTLYGNDGEIGVTMGGGEGDIELHPFRGEPIPSLVGKIRELERRIEALEG